MIRIFLAVALPALIAAPRILGAEKEKFQVVVVAEGLSNPWALADLGGGTMLVTERPGRLRMIRDGHLLPEAIKGIPPVYANGQGGLLDIELHPDYKKNGWIYLSFADPKNGGGLTKIIRGRLKEMEFVDQETIFEAPVEDYVNGGNHFGGRMQFDGKGFLFFSIGDRGDVTTPENNAQKLTNVKGKIHRLRDDGSVPKDNPFLSTPGAAPSIWSYGHRNPQGLRFDSATGILWETEHGPKGGDELNTIGKGKNYGWPVITFGINYSGTPITNRTSQAGMEQPVTYWTPSIAVSGLDIYHGNLFPAWRGNLFAGALAHRKLVRIELDGNNRVANQEILLENSGRIRDVRNFADGAIYVVYDEPGKIVKLIPTK